MSGSREKGFFKFTDLNLIFLKIQSVIRWSQIENFAILKLVLPTKPIILNTMVS